MSAICLDLRVYNEPCTDRTENARRELAHVRALDGLDVYGERRDSERLKAANLSTWLIIIRQNVPAQSGAQSEALCGKSCPYRKDF